MYKKLSNRLHFIKDVSEINLTNTKLLKIDCSLCDTTKNLFKEFQNALSFPSYFGHNWAAFNDCIWDMGWVETMYKKDRVAIYIYNLYKLLINEKDPRDKRILCEIINQDYLVDPNNPDSFVQYPVDINIYLLDSDRKYYIENDSLTIWSNVK
jgi:RNAse (barnase) inhibitor barstar